MTPLFVLCTLFSALVAGLSVADKRASESTHLVRRQAALDFTSSKWIWTANDAANEAHAFRKDFSPPLGKALIGAEIIVAGVNHLTFWVNGEILGSPGTNQQAWAARFCTDLDPSFNVFAVNGSSVGNTNGAFIATILLTYSDGTTDTLVSDSTWLSSTTVPSGFAEQSFDDTAWVPVTVRASYNQSGTPYVTPLIPTTSPTVSFEFAWWVWTDVLSSTGTVPASTRAFRRTWSPPTGGVPTSADIIITADNQYTLYVNGVQVGNGSNWEVAQHYTVNLAPSSEILVAVLATNFATSPAGVLMVMEVNMAESGRNNCTAGVYLVTDAQWVSTEDEIPTGWELPGFDDSTWPTVVTEGDYPTASPWLSSVTVAAPSPPINAF